MYRLLTPIRSIGRHRVRYLIFGLLILLLLLLSVGTRAVGGAATAQSSAIMNRYAGTFCFYDAMKPHGVQADLETVLQGLPHVAQKDWVAMHEMSHTPGLRLIGCEPSFLEISRLDGRLYENDHECVINVDYANFLLRTTDWKGIGDEITVYDTENPNAGRVKHLDSGLEFEINDRLYTTTMTVVGVIPNDETRFSSGVYFSKHQIYTTLDAVTAAYTGIENNLYYSGFSFASKLDRYPPRSECSFFHIRTDQKWIRLSEDGTHWIFRDKYTQENLEFCDAEILFSEAPPNEGIFCFVQLDDPAHAEAFRRAACGAYNGIQYSRAEERVEETDGKSVTYYSYPACQEYWYAAYLIADPPSLVESLAPVAPLCDSIAKAATAATAVLILLMTILLVHDRQYEIGVLRCIGVTSGGVCGRFVAEILVFLVIVAALGLALAVPAARLAANYLGVGDALGSVFATAVPQLALIAAATVVSCVLAAVMILQKKPMEILNSRT